MVRIISTHEVNAINNLVQGTSFNSYKEMKVKMQSVRKRLHDTWVSSLDETGKGPDNNPAFFVYHDPEYNYEAIHCFEKSKACTREAIKFFSNEIAKAPYIGPPIQELSTLDLYNGNGLTTVHLNLNGFNASSFNDCEDQVKFMNTASGFYNLGAINNFTSLPTHQFDVVFSLEVMEHYPKPLEHVKELINLVKPGGYLVESTGFNGCSENIGHFDSYWLFDEKMLFMKARTVCTRVMKKYFDVVHAGFNAAPRIWKKKLQIPNTNFEPVWAATKKWEINPRYYGANSKVFCTHNGAAYHCSNDLLIDQVNEKLKQLNKPTLFEEPRWYADGNGITKDFTPMGTY